MTASIAPVGRSPSVAPSPTRGHLTAPIVLKAAAAILFAVPACLVGGVALLVEAWPAQLWIVFLAAVAVALLRVAWLRPVPGGILIGLFGIAQEWPWFQDQLGGDVNALLTTLDDVSPAWFAIAALVTGAMFVAAGLWRKPAGP